MKKLIFILLTTPLISFGQYSNYYGTVDVNANVNQNINANVNVNKNVNVSGNINKTVTTIDYGALANANATRERNRIESLKISNEKERNALLAIANDPSKAFDFGVDNNWKPNSKTAKKWGFKKFTFYHKIPHKSLFSRINNGYNYQNISDNGVETIIQIFGQFSFEFIHKTNPSNFTKMTLEGGIENALKRKDIVVGKIFNDPQIALKNAFIHKKDLNRATVFGLDGYYATIIFEDDYEIGIIDYYVSKKGDVMSSARATFKGDKDLVDFEDLEGRRYYFNKLIKRTIGSASYINLKQ